MERLFGELFDYCSQNPLAGGVAIWGTLVTIVVWAPFLLPRKLAGVSQHLFLYGMFGIFAERLLRLTTSAQPYFPLLELAALGLTASLVWLEALKLKVGTKERKVSWIQDRYHDWMMAVRLALWLTLISMPLVSGM